MESFFKIITPITYWILVVIWFYILVFYFRKIKLQGKDNRLLKLLLLILAIDAFRTLFESMYFGAWYTSLSGMIPIEIFNYLAQPQIVFFPKIITLITGVLILLLIIHKWLPSEIIQKEEINALVKRQTLELLETNKKLIEARIKAEENETKFRALYNNSPDMYVSVSPKDALIQLCNETLMQKTGYSRAEIIGSPIFKMYHEDCMDDVKKAFELFVETGEVKDQELILKRKDGSKIEVSLNVNAVRNEKDEIIHSMSSWRDITERKIAEKELLKHRNHLEELVKDRTEVIVKQKNQVEEANRLKSEFMSNMSHELRTPLNSILALTNVLINQTQDKLSEDENEYLEVVERNGQRLLSLINDILDLSKIEAGKIDVIHESISLTNLLVTIKDSMHIIAMKKDLALSLTIQNDLPKIETDAKWLHQIVLNIVSNAVKFTNQGSVDITVKYDARCVYVEVKDNGIGISEENIKHIFDEFRQADGSISREYEGTGLGLAIASKMARILGVVITVKSQLEVGTVFTITIPIDWNEKA